MKKYLIMPENCRFYTVTAYNHKMAYSLECCWYNPSRKIAIMDTETGETWFFTREPGPRGEEAQISPGAFAEATA